MPAGYTLLYQHTSTSIDNTISCVRIRTGKEKSWESLFVFYIKIMILIINTLGITSRVINFSYTFN